MQQFLPPQASPLPPPIPQGPPGLLMPNQGPPLGLPPQGPPGMPIGMPPMAPPPPVPPPMEPDPTEGMNLADPRDLILALKALAGSAEATPPMYPRGFVKPAKPDLGDILANSRKLWDANMLWRDLVQEMRRWTRQDVSGSFIQDQQDKEFGLQERFTSSALSDERNLAIAKVSTLKASYLKRTAKEHRADGDKIETACQHIRREFEYRHALEGNRPLSIDEASMIVDTGMLASRVTFYDDDPDFPLCRKVVESTEVYPVFGSVSGLKAVYRTYRTSLLKIMETYGGIIDDAGMAKLKASFGGEQIGVTTDVNVVEYWDEWWRCVTVNETPILPVTAHQYGRVPWRIQYTGMGEAMFSRSGWGRDLLGIQTYYGSIGSIQSNRVYQAVPFLFYRIRNHELFEALMARVITGIQKGINPAMIRARSDAAAEKPMPPLDLSPGAQNETFRGEEDLSPIPTVPVGQDLQIALAALATDRENGSFPRAAFGGMSQNSNVTGVAQQMGLDAGLDKLIPLIKSFEYGEAREMELCLSLIRNFGDDAKYGGDLDANVTPLMIPGRKKSDDSFELDRELIDRVGTRVEVTYTEIDRSKWLSLLQAYQIGIGLNVFTPEDAYVDLTGNHDWDEQFQRTIDQKALINATQLPEFAKAVTVPQAYIDAITANSTDPEMVKMLTDQLNQWRDITKPQPPAPSPGMPGQPGPPGQPGSGIVSTQGVSLPPSNQAPGSGGAIVGRPMSGQNVGP